jgi:hypothetical protein
VEYFSVNLVNNFIRERSENVDKEDQKYAKGCGIVLLLILIIV